MILVAGVNGTGKTTTVGKLAWHLSHELGQLGRARRRPTRSAPPGVEQLELWAQRAGVQFVKGPPGADPGAVAYDAIATGRRDGADVVIIDTAGRLHTQDDLMAELAKVRRVIAKQIPEAPHETLLTVDATTGQNGLRQAKLFSEAIDVSGLVLTKLDGTAKGGIALAIAHELGIPVKLIGVGEQLEDLRPFDADRVRPRAGHLSAPSIRPGRACRSAKLAANVRSGLVGDRRRRCSGSARCSRRASSWRRSRSGRRGGGRGRRRGGCGRVLDRVRRGRRC